MPLPDGASNKGSYPLEGYNNGAFFAFFIYFNYELSIVQ